MIRRIALACIVVAAVSAFGQESKEDTHSRYKLEFVLKQLDHGKIISTHNYTIAAEANSGNSQIRTGNRVPIDTGTDKGLTYIDVGFNCDARIEKPTSGNAVGLDVVWDLSTMPGSTGSEKLIRQTRVRSTPLVPFGKGTLVGSVDDINSGQQFELDVTVTPEI